MDLDQKTKDTAPVTTNGNGLGNDDAAPPQIPENTRGISRRNDAAKRSASFNERQVEQVKDLHSKKREDKSEGKRPSILSRHGTVRGVKGLVRRVTNKKEKQVKQKYNLKLENQN